MSLAEKIRTRLSQENIYHVSKYLGVSVAMYVSIFLVMYLAVDIIGVSEMKAYVATYAFAYIADYLINLRYLFNRDHSWPTVIKYIVHILFFLGFGSIIFKMITLANIHYLIATLMSAIALLPLRYLAHKFVVFR
jgi:putative flippase GtrA